MPNYKILDVVESLIGFLQDGYQYIDIEEFEADDDFPSGLSFTVSDEFSETQDDVFSCDIPDELPSTIRIQPDEPCYQLIFSYKDIFTLKSSLDFAMRYFKEHDRDKSLTQKDKDEFRFLKTECLNLSAKIAKFLKKLH